MYNKAILGEATLFQPRFLILIRRTVNDVSLQMNERTRAQIRKVLSLYKENFAGWIPHELYKWRAVAWFREHWDLNAADLPAMLKESLSPSKTGNLFKEKYWNPYDAVMKMSKAEPETVRKMLTGLLDESRPLPGRIRAFKDSAARLWTRCREAGEVGEKNWHDDKAACRYLFFAYPEKYFLYQYGKYVEFAHEIGLTPGKWSIPCGCTLDYMDLASEVAEAVREDSDLLSMLNARLDDDCYRDEAFHLLADDVFWYVKKLREMPYWPAENDYNPKIDAKKWGVLLKNSAVCNEQQRNILLQMLSMDGEATCTQLAERFGGKMEFYRNHMASLARSVHKQTDCPVAVHEDGEKKYWPVLFTGRAAPGSQPGAYSWKLREELSEALESLEPAETVKPCPDKENHMDIGKNTILYGPPGTGKTYHTVNYAVAIIEGKALSEIQAESHSAVLSRFNQYREAGRIAFVTFHQSYGYEDFIEGIRPAFPDEGEAETGLSYDLIDGAFKKFCGRAEYAADGDDYGFSADSTVWKVSLGGAGENPIKTDCMKNGYIRIGWDEYGSDLSEETAFRHGGKAILNAFLNVMKPGDIALSCGSARSVDAIGVITGEAKWYSGFAHMKRFREVKWLATGHTWDIEQFGLQKALVLSTVYKLKTTAAHVKSVLDELAKAPRPANAPAPPCVFIIDEINRGNISKIFGELITLIEPEKRKGKPEYVPVKLPYSQSEFGVPDNVWILGTMNTADRSIALLDTALRRRFQFREMMPDSSALDGIEAEGVAVSGILDTLNRRIAALYDREHTLGHAWFLPLRDEPTLARLGAIFRDSVIPLLQEYFYDDYEKIRLVLGDEKRKHTGGPQFFEAEEPDAQELFGANPDFPLNVAYRLNPATLTDIQAYRNL